MKRNLGTPFWVLPALAAMGILAALVVTVGLGHNSASPVYAGNPGDAPEAANNPTTAGQIAQLTFEFDVSVNIPASAGEFQVTFDKDSLPPTSISRTAVLMSATAVTNCSGGVAAGCSAASGGTGAGGQSVTLEFDPTFDVDPNDARRVVVRMKVPDMDPSTSNPGVGVQGIAADARVTITLTTSAGFRNAEEADSQSMALAMCTTGCATGTNQIKLNGAANFNVTAPSELKIFTSSPSRRRGNSLTVIGRGYKGDLTATVWLDNGIDLDGDGDIDTTLLTGVVESTAGIDIDGDGTTETTSQTTVSEEKINIDLNGDGDVGDTLSMAGPFNETTARYYPFGSNNIGVDLNGNDNKTDTAVAGITEFNFRNNSKRDPGERDLGGAIIGGDGTFTATFTVQNPPFQSGTIGTGYQRNVINAVDGENSSAGGNNSRTVELQPVLTISPAEVAIGDTITLTLKDFTADGLVCRVTVGGVNASLTSLTTNQRMVDSNGELTIAVKIPGSGVPTGVQSVFTFSDPDGSSTDADGCGGSDLEDHDEAVTVRGATLSTSHTELIANQDVTISGSGFSEGGSVCIDAGKITLSNVALSIDSDSTDTTCSSTGVKVTSGGTFVATVIVRQATGTAFPSSLLTPGNHELKVIDSSGTEGKLAVTIKQRQFTLEPKVAGPRKTVTVIGSGYPADNADTDSPSVTVAYNCGANCTRSVTADPDFSGNFREPLRVPSNAPIPSTNTVTATISGTTTVDTITHEVPQASVSVNPGRGASGSPITVSGTGFRDFDTVQEIKVGGLGALGGRTINTDTNGVFTADGIIVPGLDPGIHSLEVTVGTGALETTANTSFEVLSEGTVGGIPTAVTEAMAPLGDSLIRVFSFNNATKSWTFFDPRPEFASANTLDQLIEGNIYWVRVSQDQLSVVLNNATRNLTCLNPGTPEEDCWNQIVW